MDALVAAAEKVRTNAYAPFSVYQVGAAVHGSDGAIYTGVNVENSSYGLTVCAERSAIVKMVSEGCREIKAVAVATSDGGTPCGMCLQTILEFSPDPDAVIVTCTGENGQRDTYRLSDLLPHGFRLESNEE